MAASDDGGSDGEVDPLEASDEDAPLALSDVEDPGDSDSEGSVSGSDADALDDEPDQSTPRKRAADDLEEEVRAFGRGRKAARRAREAASAAKRAVDVAEREAAAVRDAPLLAYRGRVRGCPAGARAAQDRRPPPPERPAFARTTRPPLAKGRPTLLVDALGVCLDAAQRGALRDWQDVLSGAHAGLVDGLRLSADATTAVKRRPGLREALMKHRDRAVVFALRGPLRGPAAATARALLLEAAPGAMVLEGDPQALLADYEAPLLLCAGPSAGRALVVPPYVFFAGNGEPEDEAPADCPLGAPELVRAARAGGPTPGWTPPATPRRAPLRPRPDRDWEAFEAALRRRRSLEAARPAQLQVPLPESPGTLLRPTPRRRPWSPSASAPPALQAPSTTPTSAQGRPGLWGRPPLPPRVPTPAPVPVEGGGALCGACRRALVRVDSLLSRCPTPECPVSASGALLPDPASVGEHAVGEPGRNAAPVPTASQLKQVRVEAAKQNMAAAAADDGFASRLVLRAADRARNMGESFAAAAAHCLHHRDPGSVSPPPRPNLVQLALAELDAYLSEREDRPDELEAVAQRVRELAGDPELASRPDFPAFAAALIRGG